MKVAVAPDGRPLADMETGLSNVPPTEGTLTLISAEPPSDTVTGVGGAVTVYVVSTVSVNAEEIEAADPAFPEYAAVTLSAPPGRLVVENAAMPLEFSGAVASKVVPLKKLTVPRGEPAGAGETVAVSVTG